MNRLYITLLTICIAPAFLRANDNADYWYRGTVYLKNGESLSTMMQHDQRRDYLIILHESGMKAYNAGQIDSYEIFDPLSRSHRTFYALPFSEKRWRGYGFFELIQEGDLILLSRENERVQEQFYPHPLYAGISQQSLFATIKEDEFYVLNKKGQLTRFDGSKKKLLKLMAGQAKEIDAFIRSKKLNLNDKMHLKAIFRYYNTLQIIEGKKYGENIRPNPLTYSPALP